MQVDYHNPNDYWNGYDPCKGMTEKERIKTALAYMVVYFIFFAIAVALCALLSGCTTTKYVPVVEHRTEHHWHTDSVKERDSTYEQACELRRAVSKYINDRPAPQPKRPEIIEPSLFGIDVHITPKEIVIGECIEYLKKEGYVIFKKV